MRWGIWAAMVGGALLASLCLPVPGVGAAGLHSPPTRPDFDSRLEGDGATAIAQATRRQRIARHQLRRELGRFGVVEASPTSAGLRIVARLDGYLTQPSERRPARIALDYVLAHADAFGVVRGDLAGLELAHRYTTPDGVTHLRWVQSTAGISLFDDDLRAAVAADGRLINVIGSPRPVAGRVPRDPAIGPRAALSLALRDVGSDRPVPQIVDPPSGQSLETRFEGFDSAELTLFGSAEGLRLGWRTIADAGPAALYQSVIDARTGELLHRKNLARQANNATVWDYHPGTAAGGTARTVDLASWLSDPATGTQLAGPNAVVWADLVDDNTNAPPSCGNEEICPSNSSAPYQWVWPYSPYSYPEGNCPSAGCSWRADTSNSWQQNMHQTGTQAFFFVNNFHDYLASDPGIAFNRASGNLEGSTDRVFVNVLDGAAGPSLYGPGLPDDDHRNNATMATLPNGQGPAGAIMQMYLWAPSSGAPHFRAVSGSDDASIVYHEYAHGLSARLVVDSAGAAALSGPQPGAMGEGWSDWYAMDYLVAKGFVTDTSTAGEVRLGDFEVTNNKFRTQGLDCPVESSCPGTASAGPGGYTYGDFGRLGRGPQVHDDGEIWGETLWDLRAAVGSATARNLITGGMRLSPPNPSFLDMRNAIIQQAQVVGGEELVFQVWKVFAARGMGLNASTSGALDTAPVEDFAAPPPPDPGPPELRLSGPKRQRASRAIRVKASCDEACTLRSGGTVSVAAGNRPSGSRTRRARRSFPLREARVTLRSAGIRTLRLSMARKARRHAMRSGGVARIEVVASSTRSATQSSKKRKVTLVASRKR